MTREILFRAWNKNKSISRKISKQIFYEVMASPDGEKKRVYLEHSKQSAKNRLQSEMFWDKPGHYEIKKMTLYFKENIEFAIGQLKQATRYILTPEKNIISYETNLTEE